MYMLYDSEHFIVVQFEHNNTDKVPENVSYSGRALLTNQSKKLPINGFEIVDKRTGKEVYLNGAWAELFQQYLLQWNLAQPTKEEVEEVLNRYATLAHTPMYIN